MAIKIKFDSAHVPQQPTLILYSRSGKCFGKIGAYKVTARSSLLDPDEFAFKVNKFYDNEINPLWEKLVDFKLVYAVEWDTFFQMTLDINETTETVKSIDCIQLGQAELSQIYLFGIEINTEDDIAREDYITPTVFYDNDNPEASLLHRIMSKAPHYTIRHVDDSIANVQRTFTFDETSLHDALNEIAEEIDCIFIYHNEMGEDRTITREISVYDLETYCLTCGYRGNYTGLCPKCDGVLLEEGYGLDTTVFITSDELTDEIEFTTDSDSVKNCFRLEGGDDLFTATIRNCNPNGSNYIWYITDTMKDDMSQALVSRLESYDELMTYYNKNYVPEFNQEFVNEYNAIATKYKQYNPAIELIDTNNIVGYPALMNAYYDTIDLELYIQSIMMPSDIVPDQGLTAEDYARLLTSDKLSPIAVNNIRYASKSTLDSSIASMAKTYIPSGYRVRVNTSTYTEDESVGGLWIGTLTVSNYKDEEDVANTSSLYITATDQYEEVMEQKLRKQLSEDIEDYSISGLFDKELSVFKEEIKKYGIARLVSFKSACQACLNILIEAGMGTKETWEGSNPNPYNDIYLPYYYKMQYLDEEIAIKTSDLNAITGIYNLDGTIKQDGLQSLILDENDRIHEELDFEKYLGETLWKEFCLYKREDTYKNDNFISDGLDNAELVSSVLEFIELAQNEIYKSAELQHSISTSSLNNLLVIQKFEPLVEYFEVGNWMRVMIDEVVYKLRLLSFEVDYDSLETINVEFSDVRHTADSISHQMAIMAKASSLASSYDSIKRQSKQSVKSNSIIKHWFETGLDTTNTLIFAGVDNQTQIWDEHGMLFRQYDEEREIYEPTQLRIINSTLAITDDDWETIKTAIGKIYYIDPETGNPTMTYGVNAETVVGKLILGEQLGIYNEGSTMTFDQNGLQVRNDFNTFTVDPSNPSILTITNNTSGDNVISFDENGNGIFNGELQSQKAHIGDDEHYIDFDGHNLVIKGGNIDLSSNEELMTTLDGFDKAINSINKYGINYQVISTPKDLDTTTVEAFVYRNGVNVTQEYPYYLFSWVKRSEEGEETIGKGYSMDIPNSIFDFNGVIIGRFNFVDTNGILASSEGGLNVLSGTLSIGGMNEN